MTHTTSDTARIAALETGVSEIKSMLDLLLDRAGVSVPSKSAPAKASKKASAGKKASKAEREAQKEAYLLRKAGNRAAAAWLRENGIVPSGQAWAAAKNGERSVAHLRSLNALDGLTLASTKATKASPATEPETVPLSAIVAQVSAQFTQAEPVKSAARVKAGRKAVAGRARDAKGRLLPKAEPVLVTVASKASAPVRASKASKVSKVNKPATAISAAMSDALASLDQGKVASLRDAGLSDAQILSALA